MNFTTEAKTLEVFNVSFALPAPQVKTTWAYDSLHALVDTKEASRAIKAVVAAVEGLAGAALLNIQTEDMTIKLTFTSSHAAETFMDLVSRDLEGGAA